MVATGVGADDMVRLAGSTMTGTLNLQGSPPLVIPEGAVSGYVATSDSSGNVSWAPSAGGGGGGSELIMTAVQTSAYSANASDYVRADTTSGSFTVTLPDEPPAGTVVGVKMTGMTAGNVTTVACSGSDVFNVTGGATSFALRTLNQGAVFQYGAGIWLVTSSDFALSSLDDRYVPVLNIAAFGATTGSSDNGPFINDAVAALPGGHGNIYVPPGTWHYTTQISVTGLSGIRFFGDAQRGNTTSTTLMYDGTGSASAINATGSAAISFDRLFLEYSSASFTGNLVDFSGTGSDTGYATIRDCYVGSGGITTAAALVCLNHCNESAIEDSHFQGGVVAIQGQTETGSYANGIKIDGCTFGANGTHIMNAAQAWTISNNVFEPCTGGTPGMYSYTTGYSYAAGLTITGNWLGDTTASSGAQINAYAQGLVISGNYIGQAAGETGIALTNSAGVTIQGNTITGGAKAIDFGTGGGNSAVHIRGNTYSGTFTTALIAGTVPADAVIELPSLGTGYGIVPSASGVVQFPNSAISVGGVPITGTLLNTITGTYGPNLLLNGDFSSTSDWSTSNPGGGMLASGATFTSASGDSADGSGTYGNVVCDATAFYEGISQTVTGLSASTTYMFQAYVKTTTGTNPQGVLIAVYDSTNSTHYSNVEVLAGSDAGWVLLQSQFTTGSSGPVTVFAVVRDASAALCTFRVSDAYLGTFTGYASTTSLAAETVRAETAEALALPKAGGTMTGALVPSVQALTFGSSVAVNAALGNAFSLTLTASTATLASPTSPADGQIIRVRVTQGSGGSFTLAYGTAYDFGAAGAPALSTAAGKVDVLAFEYVASISKWCFTGGGGLGY